MSKRLTTKEFIWKSISKHGNKYDWESDFKKINNRLCQ